MSAFNRVEDIVRNCDTAYLDACYAWDTDPHQITAELLDEHRAEVLAEAKVETVAWLVKKANEGTPVGELASKVDRGAVRIFLGTGHYQDAVDEHRAEVRRGDAARLLDSRRPHVSRAIFCDGIEHAARLLEQWADGRPEEAATEAATATPAPPVRFEEPTPPAPHGAAARQGFADQLRTRPGVWALLGTYDNARTARTSAYHIRAAANPQNQPFAPAGTFEAEARLVCGEARVYVRFVGGDPR